MSDIVFRAPCTVGSVVEFEAKVVLTHGDLMRVSVSAIKHSPSLGCSPAPAAAQAAPADGAPPAAAHAALTTTFSFLFAAPPGCAVPPVRPETLDDAADWLLAARQHREDGYPLPPPLTGSWTEPSLGSDSDGRGGGGGGGSGAGSATKPAMR